MIERLKAKRGDLQAGIEKTARPREKPARPGRPPEKRSGRENQHRGCRCPPGSSSARRAGAGQDSGCGGRAV